MKAKYIKALELSMAVVALSTYVGCGNPVMADVNAEEFENLSPFKGDRYPMVGIVIDVEHKENEDLVFVANDDMVVYSFHASVEECWYKGDMAACILDKHGTAEVFDDELVEAYYAGNVKDFEEIERLAEEIDDEE